MVVMATFVALLPVNLLAANVSLFYDPIYVRMDRANNVLQTLQKQNHNVTTFEGVDESSWAVATADADALIIPSLVWTPVLVVDLNPTAKDILENYVSSGGRFISHGAYYNRGTDLFYVFDYRIGGGYFASYGLSYGSTYLNLNTAENTSFALGQTTLPRLYGTFPLNVSILPSNALPLYWTEPVYQTDEALCDVVAAGYGQGSLLYLAWDWATNSNSDPQGIAAWEQVLNNAIAFTHPPQPIADAGPDQIVGEGELVTLDGSGSSDPENDSLNYHWRSVFSYAIPEQITLEGADTPHPTFIAPYITQNTTVSFLLEVNDGTHFSAPDAVNVTIQQTNSPPVADAGDDRSSKVGNTVTLSGLHSYDPDGNPIASYHWAQVGGPEVTLLPSTYVAEPTFVVPEEVGATLIFKLQVSDGMEGTVPSPGIDSTQADTVACTIVQNSQPIAKAGPDCAVNEGTRVTLNGSLSYDPDAGDQLYYLWEQVSGVPVQLDDPTLPMPSFDSPLILGSQSGECLRFKLVVTDDDPSYSLTSEPGFVTIYVSNSNQPPSCNLARPSIGSLWPPDHKLQPVEILGVRDFGIPSGQLSIRITGVTQDEPSAGTGNGDSSPDVVIQKQAPADTLLLRAERDGNGNGRIYRITFTASDGYESCDGSFTVPVPPSRAQTSDDDGQVYDSTK